MALRHLGILGILASTSAWGAVPGAGYTTPAPLDWEEVAVDDSARSEVDAISTSQGATARVMVEDSGFETLERPFAFTLEAFGRGGDYSANIDYAITTRITGGLGFSYGFYYVREHNEGIPLTTIPFYVSYTLTDTLDHRPYVTGGFNLGITPWDHRTQGLVPTVGIGYEYRAESGIVFRAAPYMMLQRDRLAFTAGVSVGGSL